MLWKFGISGDLPIITVPIGRLEDSALITEVVEFMDYYFAFKLSTCPAWLTFCANGNDLLIPLLSRSRQ